MIPAVILLPVSLGAFPVVLLRRGKKSSGWVRQTGVLIPALSLTTCANLGELYTIIGSYSILIKVWGSRHYYCPYVLGCYGIETFIICKMGSWVFWGEV